MSLPGALGAALTLQGTSRRLYTIFKDISDIIQKTKYLESIGKQLE